MTVEEIQQREGHAVRDKGCLDVWLEESGGQFMDLDMPLTLVFIKLYDPVTASLTVRSRHQSRFLAVTCVTRAA